MKPRESVSLLVASAGCSRVGSGAEDVQWKERRRWWVARGFQSRVVSGSPKRWDRWHSPSPNWQESHTTYIPLIVLAKPGGWKMLPTIPPVRGTSINNHWSSEKHRSWRGFCFCHFCRVACHFFWGKNSVVFNEPMSRCEMFVWVVVSNIFFFPPIWGRFPFWLIFFKWVETTN